MTIPIRISIKGLREYFRKDRRAAAGCILLGIWILLAVLVPLFPPGLIRSRTRRSRTVLPSPAHWFGTDKFGRDLFARVWYGAGLSLLVGLVSAALNGCIGVLYGAVSGYAGKKADLILMRIADVVSAIPSMLYVILITLVLGAGAPSINSGALCCRMDRHGTDRPG